MVLSRNMMTELEAIKSRHSIRKYVNRPLPAESIDILRSMIAKINALNDSQLNIQLVTGERKAFTGFLSYGKFSGVENYFVVAGRPDPDLDFNAGYYGEKLVLLAQQLGLNTCWVGLTYRKIKDVLALRPDDKIVCYISLGYGAENGTKHKIKTPQQVSNVKDDSPQWFKDAVDAALLAPTAVNQQKFHFDLLPGSDPKAEDQVEASREFSMVGYTKIDLGIACLHFEIGAHPHPFKWVIRGLEGRG